MINTVIRYLRENITSTMFWLATALAWLLFICGVTRFGNWLLVCFGVIFCLIMIMGQQRDKIKDLQNQLDKFKI
jgi:hypothetical protein